MTDQFNKYDGYQWHLASGVPGPRGPAGLQGPAGPPGGVGTGPGGLIVDADVYSAAAIQGTKISPNFGSQEVITKGVMLAQDYTYLPRRVAIDSNTVICWTFDETTTPFANSGNGGSQNLTMTPFSGSAFVAGLFNNGFNLSGEFLSSTDTVISPNSTSATLSAWVNTANNSGGNIIAKKYDTSGTHSSPFDSLAILLDSGNNGYPVFRITIGGTNTDMTSSTALSNGTWHHLGSTWDGTNFNCYVDGVRIFSVALGSGSTPIDFGSNGPWFLGQFVTGEGQVDLVVDDVRVESVARSNQYFTDVYNSAIFPNLATSTHPGDIILAGDLGGSGAAPTVVALQGIGVKSGTPTGGYVLTYNSTDTQWEAAAPPSGGGGSSIDFNTPVSGTSLFEIGGSLYVLSPGDPTTSHPSFNMASLGGNTAPPQYFQFSGAGVAGVMGRSDKVVVSGAIASGPTTLYTLNDIGYGWIAEITVLYGALEQQAVLNAAFKFTIVTIGGFPPSIHTTNTFTYNPFPMYYPAPTFSFASNTLTITPGNSPWAAICDFSVISINGGI